MKFKPIWKSDYFNFGALYECPVCHKQYSIIEEYTGWHIPTIIHCSEIPKTDLNQTKVLAEEIIEHLRGQSDLFIPQYEEIFKNVLERYHSDFRAEGLRSYDYKINSGRV